MLECLIVGDSIAQGVGQQLPQCQLNAAQGIPSAQIVGRVHDAKMVVISAGSNDGDMDRLWMALTTMRLQCFHEVIWLAPVDQKRGDIVRKVAAQFRDRVISFSPGPDGVHPFSYPVLARAVMGEIK